MAELRVALVAKRSGAFITGFRSLPQCEIVAVCDPDPAMRQTLGDRAHVPDSGRFADYEDLLERARPDVVVIASPMPFHVPQAIQALDLGVHVLSEVTAAVDLEQCRQLVQAVRRSHAQYMMAENYCYRKPMVLVRALAERGLFGRCYFAEGEYIHDMKHRHHEPDGSLTWRAAWQVGQRGCTYGTHSLAPALECFGPEARVATVSCVGSGMHTDPEHPHDDTVLMLCQLNTGGLIKVRLDMMSNRPHNLTYYSLQGTKGGYEAPRGFGDDHKIWLGENVHPQPLTASAPEWRSLWDYAEDYLPAIWRDPPEEAVRAGHGGGDYFIVHDFVQAVLKGQRPPIDVYRAMDYTVPGLISEQSINQGGVPLPVPDLRDLAQDARHW
ncbi:MAG: Gfo/Idh/MocA family oxidoreductase [Chloroflexi bacterium]|nr:Gfo/Idh/MocA family oxidoreductase [Chloroflexota bacterium]